MVSYGFSQLPRGNRAYCRCTGTPAPAASLSRQRSYRRHRLTQLLSMPHPMYPTLHCRCDHHVPPRCRGLPLVVAPTRLLSLSTAVVVRATSRASPSTPPPRLRAPLSPTRPSSPSPLRGLHRLCPTRIWPLAWIWGATAASASASIGVEEARGDDRVGCGHEAASSSATMPICPTSSSRMGMGSRSSGRRGRGEKGEERKGL